MSAGIPSEEKKNQKFKYYAILVVYPVKIIINTHIFFIGCISFLKKKERKNVKKSETFGIETKVSVCVVNQIEGQRTK